jgi:hypothetical protein
LRNVKFEHGRAVAQRLREIGHQIAQTEGGVGVTSVQGGEEDIGHGGILRYSREKAPLRFAVLYLADAAQNFAQACLWDPADECVNLIGVDRIQPIHDGGASARQTCRYLSAIRIPWKLDAVIRRRVSIGSRDGHQHQRSIGRNLCFGRKDNRGAAFSVAMTVANDGPDDAAGAKLRWIDAHGGSRSTGVSRLGFGGIHLLVVPALRGAMLGGQL